MYIKNQAINSLIVFNVAGYLYTNSSFLFDSLVYYKYNYDCLILSTICILSFNVAYYLPFGKLWLFDTFTEQHYDLKKVTRYSYVLFFFGVLIECYFIFFDVGLASFMNLTRAGRSLLLQDSFYLASFYRQIIILSFLLSLVAYLETKSRKSKLLTIASLFVCVLNSIVSVSRASIISVLIPLVYLMYIYKKLKKSQVVYVGLCIFLLMVVWKYWISVGVVLNSDAIQIYSELGTWIKIGNNILTDMSSNKLDYIYGKSYIETLINLIMPFVGFEPLSKWYVRNYEFETYLLGGGRGFSSAIEAYLNFGLMGCILVYFIYGMIFKRIFSNNDGVRSYLIQAILLSVIYKLFRSEAYSLWKNVWWLQILPVILIFRLSKQKY